MTKTIAIAPNGKHVTIGRKSYPLVYGFTCPFSGEPVALLMKAREVALKDALTRSQRLVSEGSFAGIVFHKADEVCYVSTGKAATEDGEDDRYQKVKYYYGLKEAPLIEWVKGETGEHNMSVSSFREKLFAGKLPHYRIAHELVNGRDLLIAYLSDPGE
jgi:hypothetical protein